MKAESGKLKAQGRILRAAAAMAPGKARLVVAAILAKDSVVFKSVAELVSEVELQAAGKAFESDMRPVRDAIVAALQAGDVEALRGLRAMLPELLGQVLGNTALADHFSFLLGKAVVQGMGTKQETGNLKPEGGQA